MSSLPDITKPLTETEAETAFGTLLDGAPSEEEIEHFLIALSERGETSNEIAGAARALRARLIPITAPENAIDVCGTGGDGHHTLNVSTAVSLVVAACGVPVAKHGNRNLSSKSGAADVLGQMGIEVMVGADVVEASLQEAGIGFMMAPMHHPAVAHVMPTRAELGTRTIFNILGPLTNPAGVKRQLTGAFARDLIRPMAETLLALGSEAAWLVHGSDGTDELTITGTSWVSEVADGAVADREVHPEDAGLPVHPFEAIVGGTPAENAEAFRALLHGQHSAYRDAVLLNAAAALVIAGSAATLRDGVEQAATSLDSGKARQKVEALARVTQDA